MTTRVTSVVNVLSLFTTTTAAAVLLLLLMPTPTTTITTTTSTPTTTTTYRPRRVIFAGRDLVLSSAKASAVALEENNEYSLPTNTGTR